MPRKSKKDVEKCKTEILNILKLNGNISDFALSKKIGCSRQKVWRIKKDLEENKCLWGYSVVLNQKKRGLQHYLLLLKRCEEKIDAEEAKKMIQFLFEKLADEQQIEIESVMTSFGSYDLILEINSPDVLKVRSFIAQIKKDCGMYFDEIIMLETFEILKKNWIENPKIHNQKYIQKIINLF